MSLMSKVETLKAKAQQDGANELDLMRAALVESQERYNQQAAQIALMLQKYDKRIYALEKAVERSNEQKAINVQSSMEKASQTILSNIQAKSNETVKALDEAERKLLQAKKEAKQEQDNSDNRFILKLSGCAMLLFAIGGYIATWAWGAWYDVPAKIDAINNAAYSYTQSLHK